jgi:hypothetical protein
VPQPLIWLFPNQPTNGVPHPPRVSEGGRRGCEDLVAFFGEGAAKLNWQSDRKKGELEAKTGNLCRRESLSPPSEHRGGWGTLIFGLLTKTKMKHGAPGAHRQLSDGDSGQRLRLL